MVVDAALVLNSFLCFFVSGAGCAGCSWYCNDTWTLCKIGGGKGSEADHLMFGSMMKKDSLLERQTRLLICLLECLWYPCPCFGGTCQKRAERLKTAYQNVQLDLPLPPYGDKLAPGDPDTPVSYDDLAERGILQIITRLTDERIRDCPAIDQCKKDIRKKQRDGPDLIKKLEEDLQKITNEKNAQEQRFGPGLSATQNCAINCKLKMMNKKQSNAEAKVNHAKKDQDKFTLLLRLVNMIDRHGLKGTITDLLQQSGYSTPTPGRDAGEREPLIVADGQGAGDDGPEATAEQVENLVSGGGLERSARDTARAAAEAILDGSRPTRRGQTSARLARVSASPSPAGGSVSSHSRTGSGLPSAAQVRRLLEQMGSNALQAPVQQVMRSSREGGSSASDAARSSQASGRNRGTIPTREPNTVRNESTTSSDDYHSARSIQVSGRSATANQPPTNAEAGHSHTPSRLGRQSGPPQESLTPQPETASGLGQNRRQQPRNQDTGSGTEALQRHAVSEWAGGTVDERQMENNAARGEQRSSDRPPGGDGTRTAETEMTRQHRSSPPEHQHNADETSGNFRSANTGAPRRSASRTPGGSHSSSSTATSRQTGGQGEQGPSPRTSPRNRPGAAGPRTPPHQASESPRAGGARSAGSVRSAGSSSGSHTRSDTGSRSRQVTPPDTSPPGAERERERRDTVRRPSGARSVTAQRDILEASDGTKTVSPRHPIATP